MNPIEIELVDGSPYPPRRGDQVIDFLNDCARVDRLRRWRRRGLAGTSDDGYTDSCSGNRHTAGASTIASTGYSDCRPNGFVADGCIELGNRPDY